MIETAGVYRTVEAAIEAAINERFDGEGFAHPMERWPTERRIETIDGGAEIRYFGKGGKRGAYIWAAGELAAVVGPLTKEMRELRDKAK